MSDKPDLLPRFRKHLTYANVAATLALAVACSGASYAAAKVGTAEIKNDSIRSADIKDHGIKAQDIRDEVVTARLFGNVDGSTGEEVRAEGLTSERGGGNGNYTVHFSRDVSECTIVASVSSVDNTNPLSRTIGTGYSGIDDHEVFVLTRDAFTDNRADADFSIAALC